MAKLLIEGWATTPTIDRAGQIIEPLGVAYSLPLPLLLSHDESQELGSVVHAVASSLGIYVRAEIREDRQTFMRKFMGAGPPFGFSVGYRSLERMSRPGGHIHLRTLWDELSVTSWPRNRETAFVVADPDVLNAAANPTLKFRNRRTFR